MAARRPKADTARRAMPTMHEPVPDVPIVPPERAANPLSYESLRVIGQVHKLRMSVSANLISASADQTITFRHEPYAHFKVMPQGIEIPLHNVSSAIPSSAAMNETNTREGRLEKRARRLAEKMGAASATKAARAPIRLPKSAFVDKDGVQHVESDEDDVDDSLDEDPDTVTEDDIDV